MGNGFWGTGVVDRYAHVDDDQGAVLHRHEAHRDGAEPRARQPRCEGVDPLALSCDRAMLLLPFVEESNEEVADHVCVRVLDIGRAFAERLQQLATQDLPAPVISGVQLPQLSGMAGAAGPAASYNFAEGDLMKYQNLFNQNDKDGDGFVTAGDAAALFAQSGLPRDVLRELWNLSVPSHDNKLSFREFVVGMHLVVCVSKRHLPVPGTLPAPLRDYLQGADRHAAAAAAPAPQTQTRRPSLDKSSSMPSMDLLGGDGFASKPPASAAAAATMPAAGGVPKELQSVASELVDQARRGAEAVNSISTSSNMAASTLAELVQKLKAEKISLNAAISSAEDDSRVLSGKLEASAQEIDGLRRELDSLRTRYREIQEQMLDDQAKAGGSEKEKEMLVREINNCRQMIDQLHATRGTLLAQVSEANARAAGLEASARLAWGCWLGRNRC